MKVTFRSILVLACLFTASWQSLAGEATTALAVSVDKVFEILKDPELAGDENKEERHSKIRIVLGDCFNYVEVSKRSLGKEWKKLNGEQRTEFVGVFRQLLENTYMSAFEKYSTEEVKYESERELGKGKFVVETKVASTSKVIPIHYNLMNRDGSWFVYDVKIEGVGLVKNYRTQFRKVISKKSYAALVEQLKEKVAEGPQEG
ncbi:MAG: ABC transporter substrate-binding protein [Lentisphaeria bacterium]|jgi:phospholipid transport system substrate-binding protein|nr:ABC transporter substrate-binding protein [Lentisphaeria bacterium]